MGTSSCGVEGTVGLKRGQWGLYPLQGSSQPRATRVALSHGAGGRVSGSSGSLEPKNPQAQLAQAARTVPWLGDTRGSGGTSLVSCWGVSQAGWHRGGVTAQGGWHSPVPALGTAGRALPAGRGGHCAHSQCHSCHSPRATQ